MIERARAELEAARVWAERELNQSLPLATSPPPSLHEAMRYSVFGGGKRLRPALVRLVAHALGGDDECARAPAVAIECVHTYSLVHDDLPCMDDDDLRRGRATCHKVYGEALAVLAGDALLTFAFETLAHEPRAGALGVCLARAAGSRGMVGGQALDLTLNGSNAVLEQVREIHARKTADLLGAACELGAIAARADAGQARALHAYGIAIGLLFQAVDDVLDVTGDARSLGKTPGKDARADKPTLVAALGLEGARREAERRAHEAGEIARGLENVANEHLLALPQLFLGRQS